MNYRIFNIIFIILALCLTWAGRHTSICASAYGFLLLIYLTAVFCGSYFIQLGFFLKSICSVNTREKCIALSFDDGPAGHNTNRILDVLYENKVEAAFFCIGENMKERESQLKRIMNDGHIIGNHSYSHYRFFDLFSSGKMLKELKQTSQVCLEITGHYPRFFRPPYGVTNPNLKKAISQGGFISIGWSIRSYDTVIRNHERLISRIITSLRPGAIILLHDTIENTADILPRLLKEIREKGYRIERLDKLINLNPYV